MTDIIQQLRASINRLLDHYAAKDERMAELETELEAQRRVIVHLAAVVSELTEMYAEETARD